MNWRVSVRGEVANDLEKATAWYDHQQSGLGAELVAEVLRVLDELASNPRLNSQRTRKRDIRWRLTRWFPYRVIYRIEAAEKAVVVFALLHAARNEEHWQQRLES